MEEEADQSRSAIEHPRGLYPGRLDDKGRLKLPSDFQQYLTDLGSKKVFITAFDERIARIYPIPEWKEVEKRLEVGGRKGKALLFFANDIGGDAEIDTSGRLLIPVELRKALKLENQAVRLQYQKGAVAFFSNAVYEEEKRLAAALRAEALSEYEEQGLL